MARAWDEREPATCGNENRPGCGEPIRWVVFPDTGKKMPVDAEPTGVGNVIVNADGEATLMQPTSTYMGDRYVSHFKTCPRSKDYRRPRT